MSQKDKVIHQLNVHGSVDNLWAIENYILRLGAIICTLRKQGYEFDDTKSGYIGDSKNWRYVLISPPNVQLP